MHNAEPFISKESSKLLVMYVQELEGECSECKVRFCRVLPVPNLMARKISFLATLLISWHPLSIPGVTP